MTIQSWKINIMIHTDATFKNDFYKFNLKFPDIKKGFNVWESQECQTACYPAMINWIYGGLILQEIMALSWCSNNDWAPNTIFLSSVIWVH